MTKLKDLKPRETTNGWIDYDIIGLYKDDVDNILKELKEKYMLVVPCIGRFIGTAEYYGNIQCKTLIQR